MNEGEEFRKLYYIRCEPGWFRQNKKATSELSGSRGDERQHVKA